MTAIALLLSPQTRHDEGALHEMRVRYDAHRRTNHADQALASITLYTTNHPRHSHPTMIGGAEGTSFHS
jgi:hypothetical protein